MRKYLPTLLLAFLTAATASAQEAPPPRRMPRTPVKSATLEDREVIPPSRQLSGHATIIDGERLRIGKTDMRLFGIVPPQLSASFGPQARSVLDSLANGQILTCKIRDRDHDKRLLATCINGNNVDDAH
ncbi:MAG: hypothetical protein PHE27_03810, partial [Alphaproteobacteria bacterium]|nr:hypothetical protein [Alphaproteobacteria bacterium]